MYDYATGELAKLTLEYSDSLKNEGSHQVGSTTVRDVMVASITADEVIVVGCVVSVLQIVDPNGTVTLDLNSGFRQSGIVVTRDLQQLVSEMIVPQQAPAC